MVINIAGFVVGLLILLAGFYYLVKEKNDPESKKIYGIITVVGFAITIIFILRLWVL